MLNKTDNALKNYQIRIADGVDSPFLNKIDVYQDGTVPMYRDVDGKLWAISGHSHMGHIGMFCGQTVTDMKHMYPIATDFTVGKAGVAFDNIRYPEHVCSRGSVWPFGLYICPKTHRFFCFFHNESGWNGQGTAYDSFGLCGEMPRYDSDFRHVGLMHSDDEGRTWQFDRWVLTGEQVCCSERYVPDNENIIGQKGDVINLGSGDFSLYVEPDGEYIYIFYNIIHVNVAKGEWQSCDLYVARTRKREDGVMGDFVKYYEGSFCEAGNLGKETPIMRNAWHARIAYSKPLKEYVMVSTIIFPNQPVTSVLGDYIQICTSKDMLTWSDTFALQKDGQNFGNHYNAIVSDSLTEQPNIIGDSFWLLTGHNGTDVTAYLTKIEK